MPHDPSRRDTLRGLAALASLSVVPACERNPAPDDEVPEPKAAITHHVILMMENRSFDHYFGARSLEEGLDGVDGLTADLRIPDADGTLFAPVHLRADCLEDPPHGWNSSHLQFNEGANDGFIRVHQGGTGITAQEAIGYYTRAELPIYYALADDHALCDRWFASVMGPTWPNRFYSLCGTSQGMTNNDFSRTPFPAPSIFRQLTEAGVPWRIYVHDVSLAALLQDLRDVPVGQIAYMEDFYAACADGSLPEVTFVEPAFTLNDDHPPHATALGQLLVGNVYQALTDGPLREHFLMVLDYDEHGGFYDHVPPPKADDDHAAEGFDQLGFRIPALVLGPYTKVGTVSTVYDHTSVLKHLQNLYSLPALTARNEAAADLSDCLDHDRIARRDPRPPTTLPTLEFDPDTLDTACVTLAGNGQEDLAIAYDAGQVRPEWDFRDRRDETVARFLARSERNGLMRVVRKG